MLTLLQAATLGLLQGITELFPLSSLGHSVLIPSILRWNIDQSSDQFLAFLVATHLATALVLFLFFFKDWMRIIGGILRSLKTRRLVGDVYAKLGWLLIVGTIPAGLLGLLFQKKLQLLFAAPVLVAFMLVLNGLVLYAAEVLRRRAAEGSADDAKLARLNLMESFVIGCAQAFALIPGFSRTGVAMTGGLLSGLSHENAARFSFLLATPIIAAAAVLKLPDVFKGGDTSAVLVGALCAAVAAWVSVRFLVRYFETKTLKAFALYCVVAGIIALVLLH